MGFNSYEDLILKQKAESVFRESIRRLESLYTKNTETINELKSTITRLEEQRKIEQDKNERRFAELYAYMNKLEEAYYNGLRLPKSTAPNTPMALQSLVGSIEEKNSMEELYGKRI